MNSRIIAVDFDGTLCENNWPEIGSPNEELITHLINRQKDGDKLILWTCRVDDMLQVAIEWCRGKGLIFDAVNENLPEIIESFGSDTRKIFANEYIDDRNTWPLKNGVDIFYNKHGNNNRKEGQMLKVFIIGSVSCEMWIKIAARFFKKVGCEVDYAKKQPEKRFDTLVAEAFRSIADADLIVAIGKADETFGEGTTYELAFAEFIGKVIIKFNLEEEDER